MRDYVAKKMGFLISQHADEAEATSYDGRSHVHLLFEH